MSLLTRREVAQLEQRYVGGIPSAAIVEAFRGSGERFSEPTLRKYVQLGLLPKSERVGVRGRHRGSSGIYPASIVRQINEIKAALERGSTLDEVRFGTVALGGEIEHLERVSRAVTGKFAVAIDRRNGSGKQARWRQKIREHERALKRSIQALRKFSVEVGTVTVNTSDSVEHGRSRW